MDMRHGGLVLRDMKDASGTAEFIASKKRVEMEVGTRVPHGISDSKEAELQGVPQAIVISGAGTEGANGIYRSTDKEECDAPVYENVRSGAFKIARNATTSKKTGRVKHGWLLSERSTALYGVPTESRVVPSSAWKTFGGSEPLPAVTVHQRVAGAFFEVADQASAVGQAALDNEEWQAARDAFSSSLEALDRSGDRFGGPFEGRAALLLARRAAALARLGDGRSALRDAIAALELAPGMPEAEAAAREAARAEGWDGEAAGRLLEEEAGKGRILDRGAPLALRIVEKWLDDFAQRGRQRAPYIQSGDYRQQSEMWTDSHCTRQVY